MSKVINGKDDRVARRVDKRDPHDGMIPNITTIGRTVLYYNQAIGRKV